MYPHERSLVKDLADKPFAIVGVNSDADLETLKSRLEEESITWRSFWDKGLDGEIATQWNVRGWPTIYVLDHEGVIRYKSVRGKAMDEAVEALLKEMGEEVPPPVEHE